VGIEVEVSAWKKTGDRYFGPYEVERKNQGGAYILRESDRILFRHNPTAAFCLLPYITRDHWFMRENDLGIKVTKSDSEDDEVILSPFEDDWH
jgi:hypothetical protein